MMSNSDTKHIPPCCRMSTTNRRGLDNATHRLLTRAARKKPVRRTTAPPHRHNPPLTPLTNHRTMRPQNHAHRPASSWSHRRGRTGTRSNPKEPDLVLDQNDLAFRLSWWPFGRARGADGGNSIGRHGHPRNNAARFRQRRNHGLRSALHTVTPQRYRGGTELGVPQRRNCV